MKELEDYIRETERIYREMPPWEQRLIRTEDIERCAKEDMERDQAALREKDAKGAKAVDEAWERNR